MCRHSAIRSTVAMSESIRAAFTDITKTYAPKGKPKLIAEKHVLLAVHAEMDSGGLQRGYFRIGDANARWGRHPATQMLFSLERVDKGRDLVGAKLRCRQMPFVGQERLKGFPQIFSDARGARFCCSSADSVAAQFASRRKVSIAVLDCSSGPAPDSERLDFWTVVGVKEQVDVKCNVGLDGAGTTERDKCKDQALPQEAEVEEAEDQGFDGLPPDASLLVVQAAPPASVHPVRPPVPRSGLISADEVEAENKDWFEAELQDGADDEEAGVVREMHDFSEQIEDEVHRQVQEDTVNEPTASVAGQSASSAADPPHPPPPPPPGPAGPHRDRAPQAMVRDLCAAAGLRDTSTSNIWRFNDVDSPHTAGSITGFSVNNGLAMSLKASCGRANHKHSGKCTCWLTSLDFGSEFAEAFGELVRWVGAGRDRSEAEHHRDAWLLKQRFAKKPAPKRKNR